MGHRPTSYFRRGGVPDRGSYASNTNQTHVWSAESLWGRGRHGFTFGGDVRRQIVDVLSQQNARGEFSFTGALTGSDLADFLLGIPHTSAIASGNPDKSPPKRSAYDLYPHRRLEIQSRSHGECRCEVEMRGADDRAVRPSGEP